MSDNENKIKPRPNELPSNDTQKLPIFTLSGTSSSDNMLGAEIDTEKHPLSPSIKNLTNKHKQDLLAEGSTPNDNNNDKLPEQLHENNTNDIVPPKFQQVSTNDIAMNNNNKALKTDDINVLSAFNIPKSKKVRFMDDEKDLSSNRPSKDSIATNKSSEEGIALNSSSTVEANSEPKKRNNANEDPNDLAPNGNDNEVYPKSRSRKHKDSFSSFFKKSFANRNKAFWAMLVFLFLVILLIAVALNRLFRSRMRK